MQCNTFLTGWKDLWDQGIHPWQKDGINPKLERFCDILVQVSGKSQPKECRFFVPLCGKSKDLLFLQSKGFKVVGCEAVEKACEDFFVENNIAFDTKQLLDDKEMKCFKFD